MEIKKKKNKNIRDDFDSMILQENAINSIGGISDVDLSKHMIYVKKTAKLVLARYTRIFENMNMSYEEVESILSVYAAIYLKKYSIMTDPERMSKYTSKFLKRDVAIPTDSQLFIKDRNMLINFLKHRSLDLSKQIERKLVGILAFKNERVFVAKTKHSIPASIEMISKDPESYGYRILRESELKELKTKYKKKNLRSAKDLFDSEGFPIMYLEILNDAISSDEYHSISQDQFMDGQNPYTSSPEECLMYKNDIEDGMRSHFVNDLIYKVLVDEDADSSKAV